MLHSTIRLPVCHAYACLAQLGSKYVGSVEVLLLVDMVGEK